MILASHLLIGIAALNKFYNTALSLHEKNKSHLLEKATTNTLMISNLITSRKLTYLYILAVFPSSSGMAISGAVPGYVTGIYGFENSC